MFEQASQPTKTHHRLLWLAVYFPRLPLDALTLNQAGTTPPTAIYETQANRQRICALNTSASAAGITVGQSYHAAQALVSGLQALPRDLQAEAACLQRLAQWALKYSSSVHIETQGLVLEIGGSLKLFRGLKNLAHELPDALTSMGYQVNTGVAPTPLAAILFARAQTQTMVTQHDMLHQRLARLPVAVLQYPQAQLATLNGLGLKTLGDCLQLPRAELSRRLGTRLRHDLDKALGVMPDPRPRFVPAPTYFGKVLLPAPVTEVEPLLFLLQRLLGELCGFLQGHGSGAQQLLLRLLSPHGQDQDIQLALLKPSRNPRHLLELWKEKLERQSLAAAVEGLELHVPKLHPLATVSADLLQDLEQVSEDLNQLIERLRNRLGADAIQYLQCLDEHRPERAAQQSTTFPTQPRPANAPCQTMALRPNWLLNEPQALSINEGIPEYFGCLTLLEGPERIETGWWDQDSVRRDYYIASNPRHQRLWIFRTLDSQPRWYLHGLFS